MTTLNDVFDLPDAGSLRATDFVVKLDAARDPKALKKLVDEYVVTPAVAEALPKLFNHFQETVERQLEYGHILHGGFGSGKSHLMTLLSLLLEGNDTAWSKDHPVFDTLRDNHHSWVTSRKLLIVRAHLLSARATGDGLGDILLAAVNRALVEAGHPPLSTADQSSVLDALKQEAADYPDRFWAKASAAGVADSMEDVELYEQLGGETLDAMVKAYVEMKGGRVAGSARVPWGEMLKRIATHVHSLGYGGIAWLVDEFLLWLGEKADKQFVAAINDMNTIVDHSTGNRDVPMLVVFARQRNIREFFPEIKGDSQLNRQDEIQHSIDHHAKRFDVTQLQDIELRHIVKGRVLANPTDPDAVDQGIQDVLTNYSQVLDSLLGGQSRDVLDDVYPFHPALIDVLVDVSNLMQRERSALRMLYEILSANRDFPMGHLIPVGRAFEHVFPPAGVEAAQKTGTLQAIHREWYNKLEPTLQSFCRASREDSSRPEEMISAERERTLEQALKTVLIGIVSARLAGERGDKLTLNRLVALNFADADGPGRRNKVNRLSKDLQAFSVIVPELQLVGTSGSMVLRYALNQAGLAEVLRSAKERVKGDASKLNALGRVLEPVLGPTLKGLCTARDSGIRIQTLWRGTQRRGRVSMVNVRDTKYALFAPEAGDSFRLLIDYPWDAEGHSVDEDRVRVANVRQQGTEVSAAWLPRHFTTDEHNVLLEYAAAQWILDGGLGGELLRDYGQTDRQAIMAQAEPRAAQLHTQLSDIVKAAYAEGEVKALIGPRDPDLGAKDLASDMTRILHELLDRKYPLHPPFERAVTKPHLQQLKEWLDEAEQAHGSTHYSPDLAPVLKHIGAPLELVIAGQSRAQINRDGRFLKAVTHAIGNRDTASWDRIAEDLRNTYGLTDDVLSILLCAICATGYRLRDSNKRRVEPKVGLSSRGIQFERASLLELSAYQRVEKLARELFSINAPAHRSIGTQDKLAEQLMEKAKPLRADTTNLHESLAKLDAKDGDRAQDCRALLKALAPLVDDTDSFTALTAWLAAWPEEDDDLQAQAHGVVKNNRAVQEVQTDSREHIISARHGELGERIELCLGQLSTRLLAHERERNLRVNDAVSFNQEAAAIIKELLGRKKVDPTPPPPPPPGWERVEHRFDSVTQADLDSVFAELKQDLQSGRLGALTLSWRRRKQ